MLLHRAQIFFVFDLAEISIKFIWYIFHQTIILESEYNVLYLLWFLSHRQTNYKYYMYVDIYHRSTTTNNNKIIKSPEKRKQQQIKVFS